MQKSSLDSVSYNGAVNTWEDGKFKSEESRSAIWLELDGEQPHALWIGIDDYGTIRSFANKLSDSIGVPIRTVLPENSPPGDEWDMASD